MKIGRIFYVYDSKEIVRIEQLIDAWAKHNSINFLLIDAVTYARMQKSSGTRGYRTIDQQWIHIHNTVCNDCRSVPEIFLIPILHP